MTDPAPDAESPPLPPRRGLWAVMGQTDPTKEASATEAAVDESSVAPVEDSSTEVSPPAPAAAEEATPNVTPSGRRGLWSLMRRTPTEPAGESAPLPTAESEMETAATADSGVDEPAAPVAPPRGLFSLMQRAANAEAPPHDDDFGSSDSSTLHSALRTPPGPSPGSPLTDPAVNEGMETEEPDDAFDEPDADADDRDRDETRWEEREDDGLVAPLTLSIGPDDLEPPRYLRLAAAARRQGWIGLACGIAAIAASALAMLPQFWIGFPATGLGFAAIIAGYVTLTGAARHDMAVATRVSSLLGMGLGTLGIFLGPLLFSGLGRDLREATGRQATSRHLEQMGVALNRYHDQHSVFPVGGVFTRDAAGIVRGQHGWMTSLLPFVGEQELSQSIDRDKPYDDPANRVAMGRDVVTFFAAGGDRAKILGYAVSHFAGVGGEIDDAKGVSHVGIFQRDEPVKKQDVTDGLSNTLVVGELAGNYPPWGDPENWRTIGRGLNRDANGFGNSTHNGASFLLADGSIRFFHNQTDQTLLLRLSTRDGGE